MRHLRKLLLALSSILLIVAVLLAGCSGDAKEATEANPQDKSITVGLFNWAENIAVSNMWKVLLEEKGYNVEIVTGDKSPVWTGVAQGDLDLHFEAWMPSTDKPLWDEYSDTIERHGPWFEGTALGLAVPTYVDIDSIAELNKNRDRMIYNNEPAIVGIDSGSSLMKLTQQAVKDYNLDFKLISSSGPVMSAAVTKAYENEEPIVATLWKPHWIFSQVDLKFLEDPKNIYGQNENIYFVSHQSFADSHPQVLTWMQNWKMNDSTLGSLMATIKDADSPESGAQQWIEKNRDVVNTWFE